MSPVGLSPLKSSEWCDLFVDGTCAHPKEPKLRYGAWAVTLAADGPGQLSNTLVLGGHLQGLCQSAFRAELAGVLHALQWASSRCLKLTIWSDCQGVVIGLRKLLRGGRVRPNRAHSDLWHQIETVLQEDTMEVQVIKVVSHCQVSAAQTPEEEWACWHNQLTDQAAVRINGKRPPEFWQAWDNLSQALTQQRQLHMAILQMLLKQSRLVNQDKEVKPRVQPPQQLQQVEIPRGPDQWHLPQRLFQRYGQANIEAIHSWWSRCGHAALQSEVPIKLVCGVQLFLDFQWSTNHWGPFLFKKRWYTEARDAPPGCTLSWGDRIKPFLLLWQAYLKTHGVSIPSKMARPVGFSFSKWFVSYYLRWPSDKVALVDAHVTQVLGRQVASQRDVSCLMPIRHGP